MFQINSPDCSPMFQKHNFEKSAFSPVFAQSGLRNSRTLAMPAKEDKVEKVEEKEEKDEPMSEVCEPSVSYLHSCIYVFVQDSSEYADDEGETESGNSSDCKPASPTPVETDSIHVLNEMGFNQPNGDILTAIRKKR